MGKLDDKVVIITGAAGGIGKATVKLFIKEGARVVLADILDESGEALAKELGSNAEYFHTDVSQESDIRNVIDFTMEKFGKIDVVFSNAGNPGPTGNIEEISLEDFDKTVAIHLRAYFLLLKYSLPIMKKQHSGNFISTSSVAGFQHGFGTLPYSVSKAAIIQMTRYAAVELGIFGIRANSIAPGGISTGIFGEAFGLSRKGAEKMGGLMRNILASNQPLRKAGIPEHIAKAALYLASDDSEFVSGQTIVVDGGLLSGRIPAPPPEEMMKNWSNIIQNLDPEDQAIIGKRMEINARRSIKQLEYLSDEDREKAIKQMKEMAERREKALNK